MVVVRHDCPPSDRAESILLCRPRPVDDGTCTIGGSLTSGRGAPGRSREQPSTLLALLTAVKAFGACLNWI